MAGGGRALAGLPLVVIVALASLRLLPRPRVAETEVLDARASQAYAQERWEDAAEYARHAVTPLVSPDPRRAGLLCLRGEALLRAGHAREAIEPFTLVVEAGPGPHRPQALHSGALAREAAGDPQGAASWRQQLRAEYPETPWAQRPGAGVPAVSRPVTGRRGRRPGCYTRLAPQGALSRQRGCRPSHGTARERVMRNAAVVLLSLVGFLCPRGVRAEGVAIDHKAVGCVVANKYPRLNACFAPRSGLARARVYFRVVDAPPDWYYVEMASGQPCHAGILPRPKKELVGRRIQYYVDAFDRSFTESRTPENEALVVADASECHSKLPLAPVLDSATVAVFPGLPAGFAGGAAGLGAGAAAALALGGAAVVGGGVAVAAGGDSAGGSTPTTTEPPTGGVTTTTVPTTTTTTTTLPEALRPGLPGARRRDPRLGEHRGG